MLVCNNSTVMKHNYVNITWTNIHWTSSTIYANNSKKKNSGADLNRGMPPPLAQRQTNMQVVSTDAPSIAFLLKSVLQLIQQLVFIFATIILFAPLLRITPPYYHPSPVWIFLRETSALGLYFIHGEKAF